MKITQTDPKDPCTWMIRYEYCFMVEQEPNATTVLLNDGTIHQTKLTKCVNGFKWSSNE